MKISHLDYITWVVAKLMAMPMTVEIACVMENIFPRWVLGTHLDRRDKAGDPLLPLKIIFHKINLKKDFIDLSPERAKPKYICQP